MKTYNTQNYRVFGLPPSPGTLKNTAFQKLDVFHPQVSPPLHLRMKQIQFLKCCVLYNTRQWSKSKNPVIPIKENYLFQKNVYQETLAGFQVYDRTLNPIKFR
jgi:hypothetical protein